MMKFILMIEDIINHFSVNEETIEFIKRLNNVSADLLTGLDLDKVIPLNNEDLVERANTLREQINKRKVLLESGSDIVNKYKCFEDTSEKVELKAEEFNINNSNIAWYEIIIGILIIYWLFF